MAEFDALAAGLTDAVLATFGELDARLEPADGSPALDPIRADVMRGTTAQTLERGSVIAPRSTARIPYADAPALKRGDVLIAKATRWRIAAAPNRPGNGLEWEAELEELGPAQVSEGS